MECRLRWYGKKYVKYRSLTDNSDSFPQHINLRNKESGWSHYAYSVEFAYADKKRYLCKNGDDPFMQLFVKRIIFCGNLVVAVILKDIIVLVI